MRGRKKGREVKGTNKKGGPAGLAPGATLARIVAENLTISLGTPSLDQAGRGERPRSDTERRERKKESMVATYEEKRQTRPNHSMSGDER